jgi:sterol desaturase/sphingolipid hydroxylase (fatty acid hydroxylase superfamily)
MTLCGTKEIDMELFVILALGYAASWLTFVLLKRAFDSESAKDYIISPDPERSVDSATLHRSVRLNSLVSVGFMLGCSFAFSDFLVYSGDVVLWQIPLQIVTVTLIYDFAYYAIHRYPFHEWAILRSVHAVHHMTRHPRGIDSLLLHPLETCIGLGAFLASVAVVGGVHVYSFAVLFIAYTTLNVINHAGLNFQRFPLRTVGMLAVKHDKHHRADRAGNYAFLTTIPDSFFGTAE